MAPEKHILERAIEVSAYQDIIDSLQGRDQHIYKDDKGNRYMFWSAPHETKGKGFKFMDIDKNKEKLFQLADLDKLIRKKDSIEDY